MAGMVEEEEEEEEEEDKAAEARSLAPTLFLFTFPRFCM